MIDNNKITNNQVNTSPLAGEVCFQYEHNANVRKQCEGYNKPAHRQYADYIKDFARNLRKNSTPQEIKFWSVIRNNQLGFKFRRQFNIDDKYVADYVCLEKRLIVELDGGQHNESFNDVIRTFYIQKQHFKIIRFWNNEIDSNFEGCIELLINELKV